MTIVAAITTNPTPEIVGTAERPVRWLNAFRRISSTTSRRNPVMADAATVSYLRWPYGWSWSGGCPAARTPTSPTTFDDASANEWKPSERILMAPLAYPNATFAIATATLSSRTRVSTRLTSAWRGV